MGSKALSKSDSQNTLDAAVMVMAAMRHFAGLREVSEDEHRKEQRRLERIHNRRESFRTMLDIIEWRYLLLPVGICERRQMYYENDVYAVRVTTRSLHFFGIRVARWVTQVSLHRILPEPTAARLRLRAPRRRPFRKLHR